MNPRRSALVFEYDSFPPVAEDQWQGSELQHARALAGVIGGYLRSERSLRAGDPVSEDFGAVLDVEGPGGVARLTVSFYPRDSSDFAWSVVVGEQKSLLRALTSSEDDERIVGPVKEALDCLVRSRPGEFKRPEWLEETQL